MKSYKEFKRENNVEKFNFRQSKSTKRWGADCDFPLVVSGKFTGDGKELAKFLAEDVYVTPQTSKTGDAILVICHQGWGDSAEG
jgi:hypothetical protein